MWQKVLKLIHVHITICIQTLAFSEECSPVSTAGSMHAVKLCVSVHSCFAVFTGIAINK